MGQWDDEALADKGMSRVGNRQSVGDSSGKESRCSKNMHGVLERTSNDDFPVLSVSGSLSHSNVRGESGFSSRISGISKDYAISAESAVVGRWDVGAARECVCWYIIKSESVWCFTKAWNEVVVRVRKEQQH